MAAQSVIMTCQSSPQYHSDWVCRDSSMFRQLILRTGVVTSNRVGNLLGACSANGARNAAHASALTSVVIGSLIMIAEVWLCLQR